MEFKLNEKVRVSRNCNNYDDLKYLIGTITKDLGKYYQVDFASDWKGESQCWFFYPQDLERVSIYHYGI
jgi:hypothetical protein